MSPGRYDKIDPVGVCRKVSAVDSVDHHVPDGLVRQGFALGVIIRGCATQNNLSDSSVGPVYGPPGGATDARHEILDDVLGCGGPGTVPNDVGHC